LDGAVEFALRTTKTDKIIIFDGAVGGINVSRSLAEHLLEVAPSVEREVEEVLMPKWLYQRGIDPNAPTGSMW
jgi:hypothetical protein